MIDDKVVGLENPVVFREGITLEQIREKFEKMNRHVVSVAEHYKNGGRPTRYLGTILKAEDGSFGLVGIESKTVSPDYDSRIRAMHDPAGEGVKISQGFLWERVEITYLSLDESLGKKTTWRNTGEEEVSRYNEICPL